VTPARRGFLARIGIAALNLIVPGLGLLRLGRWRAALSLYGLKLAAICFLRFGPPAPFAVWAIALVALIAAYLVAVVLAWFLSRQPIVAVPFWSRWYAIAGVALAAILIDGALVDQERLAYRNFYVPAESMSPTLPKGDRFVAYMRPASWQRGDVLLVRAPAGDIYVKRLAALPGDTIAMRNGTIILNDRAIVQTHVATAMISDQANRLQATVLAEKFPGEMQAHRIYDLGKSAGDDFGPITLGPDQYFLLGDHRDRSADSRFSKEEFGLEILSGQALLGRALFHSWGSSRPIGTTVSRPR
jgi:signal peptidase I